MSNVLVKKLTTPQYIKVLSDSVDAADKGSKKRLLDGIQNLEKTFAKKTKVDETCSSDDECDELVLSSAMRAQQKFITTTDKTLFTTPDLAMSMRNRIAKQWLEIINDTERLCRIWEDVKTDRPGELVAAVIKIVALRFTDFYRAPSNRFFIEVIEKQEDCFAPWEILAPVIERRTDPMHPTTKIELLSFVLNLELFREHHHRLCATLEVIGSNVDDYDAGFDADLHSMDSNLHALRLKIILLTFCAVHAFQHLKSYKENGTLSLREHNGFQNHTMNLGYITRKSEKQLEHMLY